MKVYDCPQRSPEWFAARVGKLTASRASDMLATIKTGEAAARRDLRTQLVCERLTGLTQEDPFVNAVMQRGIDKEKDAFAAYEAVTGNLAMPCGFVAHDLLQVGCSPDGVVGDFEGVLELKCPKTSTHLSYIKAGLVPKDYLPQLTCALWVTDALWVDFVSFDDRLPAHLRVFHRRLLRIDADVAGFELMARAFLAEVDREVAGLREVA